MAKTELDTLLQEAENQLELVRFGMVQALQCATLIEGEIGTPSAVYKLEGEYLNVLYGCESTVWNLCDRIHEVLADC